MDRDDLFIHNIVINQSGTDWHAAKYKCQVRVSKIRINRARPNKKIENRGTHGQALVKAKNEEIFSLREKNRQKDIQIVLLKDENLKKSRVAYNEVNIRSNKGQIARSSTPPIRSAPPKMNGQMRAVLPVNGGQVVNKVHQVNGGHLITNVTNGGQIVRKVQNVNNLNQLKLPAGSKLIQVGNQKLPVTPVVTKFPATNATQFTSGFNQPIRMVRKTP